MVDTGTWFVTSSGACALQPHKIYVWIREQVEWCGRLYPSEPSKLIHHLPNINLLATVYNQATTVKPEDSSADNLCVDNYPTPLLVKSVFVRVNSTDVRKDTNLDSSMMT
jgi:hypothetical protein